MQIDQEFRDLIPPLSAAEKAELRAGLIQAKRAISPLVIWRAPDRANVLIDGHNRYEICTELGLPFETTVLDLPDRTAVKRWIFEHQIARRNLTPDQIVMLAVLQGTTCDRGTAKMYERARVVMAAGRQAQVLGGQVSIARVWGGLQPSKPRTRPATPPTPFVAPLPPLPRETAQIAAEARAREKTRILSSEARKLQDRLVELEDAVSFVHSAAAHPARIETPSARPKSGKRIADPVFLVSDLHFGEYVTEEESLDKNRYDLEVAATRMRKCWDNMLWLRDDMSRTQSCDNTILYLNGDIVSGDIHDELRETNDGGIRSQCDAAVRALLPGIAEMADATPGILHIVCIGGNHGRLTHKQHIKNGTEHSAEHLGVYDPLRRVLGDRSGKIAWHIPSAERFIMPIHGRKVSVQHGTMIRSQGGIGGTLVPMTRWVTRCNDADLYLFGHFHEADAYGRIIKNGALIGESGYTKWLGVESRPPEQVAFVLDADAGVRRFERVSVL